MEGAEGMLKRVAGNAGGGESERDTRRMGESESGGIWARKSQVMNGKEKGSENGGKRPEQSNCVKKLKAVSGRGSLLALHTDRASVSSGGLRVLTTAAHSAQPQTQETRMHAQLNDIRIHP